MSIQRKDLKIETMRGTGPGGQHRNKTDSACRITHIPTGISAYADERSQKHSKKSAMEELERLLLQRRLDEIAKAKKLRRDFAIHNTETIRTYNFDRGIVKDHRSRKTASIKDVLGKGRIELMR